MKGLTVNHSEYKSRQHVLIHKRKEICVPSSSDVSFIVTKRMQLRSMLIEFAPFKTFRYDYHFLTFKNRKVFSCTNLILIAKADFYPSLIYKGQRNSVYNICPLNCLYCVLIHLPKKKKKERNVRHLDGFGEIIWSSVCGNKILNELVMVIF